MSIEEQRVEGLAPRQGVKQSLIQEVKPRIAASQKKSRHPWRPRVRQALPLVFCLLAALLLRILLVVHTNGVVNGDEALVGIQAEHILRGEHPYYYYGQPYMGSLEAYLMAALFAIAGASAWTLRAEPILLSLVVVWLTWRLAGMLADAAQLPGYAKIVFQTVAALFAAIPPLYDTVQQLRTLGGYIETFILMLLLLLSALQLTRRWQAGASQKEIALRWAGIGFIIGLGIWVDPLIISAVLAAAVWILVFFAGALLQARRKEASTRLEAVQTHVANLFLAVVALPACLLGAAPAIRWGARNHWANIHYILQQGQPILDNNPSLPQQRLPLARALFHLFTNTVAPRVIGGSLPVETTTLGQFFRILFVISLCCILITTIAVLLSLAWHHPVLVRMRQLAALPLLFGFCTVLVFCTSPSSALGLLSSKVDFVDRYASPLMLALPFFFATVITIASIFIYQWGTRRKQRASLAKGQERSFSSRASITPPASSWRLRVALVLQAILVALAACYLIASTSTYERADPGYTFQSPSCLIAPANFGPIIAYLQQEHVHYAWALTWIGYPITFETQERIITADPRLIAFNSGVGRMPSYLNDLLHADRPALLAFINHNDPHPLLLQLLDSMHITYHARRFPSEPGTDVLAVTALSQTVTIKHTAVFQQIFPDCPT